MGGEQPALDWLRYDNYDSPGILFTRAALQKGASAALTEFAGELSSGAIPESILNSAGYTLMGSKKTADAILVFQKNVELHPDSWNAYDSLGEAYMNSGDKALAVKSYRKSVQLEPTNENGRSALKKLGEQ
jgi:Flp pilus assembly protein TadD